MHLGGWSILKIIETSSLACFFLFLAFMAWFCDCSVIQFWNCKGSHIGPKSLAVIFQSTWSLPWKAHVPKHIMYDSKIMAEYHWIRKLIRDISVPYSLKSLPSSALFCLVMLSWSINRLGPTTSVSWGTHMACWLYPCWLQESPLWVPDHPRALLYFMSYLFPGEWVSSQNVKSFWKREHYSITILKCYQNFPSEVWIWRLYNIVTKHCNITLDLKTSAMNKLR